MELLICVWTDTAKLQKLWFHCIKVWKLKLEKQLFVKWNKKQLKLTFFSASQNYAWELWAKENQHRMQS